MCVGHGGDLRVSSSSLVAIVGHNVCVIVVAVDVLGTSML